MQAAVSVFAIQPVQTYLRQHDAIAHHGRRYESLLGKITEQLDGTNHGLVVPEEGIVVA